jgi:hypothetical protein
MVDITSFNSCLADLWLHVIPWFKCIWQYLVLFIETLGDNFKTIISLIGLCLSGYFAYQKIGNHITITYQINSGRYTDEQINKFVITNKKDKTISIWSIHVVVDKDLTYNLYSPDTPLILKGGESVSKNPEPYSYLSDGTNKYTPNFISSKIEFFANIGNKIIKCRDQKITKNERYPALRNLSVTKLIIDEQLFNQNVKFALIYFWDNKKHIAFFEPNGFIGNQWSLAPNHMGSADYDEDDIQNMLVAYGYDKLFTNYICLKRNEKMSFDLAFNKKA